jgi:hypothetical protein
MSKLAKHKRTEKEDSIETLENSVCLKYIIFRMKAMIMCSKNKKEKYNIV